MSENVQSRIANLESENTARKALYPVAGSLASFSLSRSNVFHLHSPSGTTDISLRVRFTPSKTSVNGKYLITLRAMVAYDTAMTNRMYKAFAVTEPQTGDGSVVIKVAIGTAFEAEDYYVRVTASGSSEGVFNII